MDQPLDPLTRRELEIIQLLADGLSDQEIAEKLVLSSGTVKWHVKNVYSKLGTHKRTAAIAHARALGLLKLDDQPESPRQDAPKHNLLQQTHACIGREVDTTNILSMMNDAKCRLITLVGMGGIGKTRLAIHCAGQLIDTFADGVFFVNLEAISAGFLSLAIADALNLQLFGQGDSHTKLIQLLRHKKMLLILDNFEHLVSEAETIAQILAAAPRLKLLVTSRETLNLSEEWVYSVEGLSTPDNDEVSNIRAFGAPLMFIERARRIRQDFDASANLHWIVRLCKLVGGMPLAIELLATWMSVLTCEEIVSEVQRNRDLIATSRRDIPDRHRTMRAVFDHSWALLNADEQDVFMKMAVFAGGLSREAAEQIAGASLWLLMSLTNKSLIFATKDRRFDLHPLLKHYAEEKLQASAENEWIVRERHSQYYGASIKQRPLINAAQFWQDAENIWTGMAYANAHRLTAAITDYAQGLWTHFEKTGWHLLESDVLHLYRDSIAVLEGENEPSGAVRNALLLLYECLGNSLHSARQYAEARETFQKALAYHAGDNPLAEARLYRRMMGTYAARRTDSDAMFVMYQAAEKALERAHNEDDSEWWEEWNQLQLEVAWVYYFLADNDGLQHLIERIETSVRSRGTPLQLSKLLHIHAIHDLRRYLYRSLPDETLERARDALNAARESGDLQQVGWLQFSLGFVHLWRDEFDAAEGEFLAALELARQFGDSNGTYMTTLAYLPLIYRRRQQVDLVEQWALKGRDAAQPADAPLYIGNALAHLGWVLLRRGENPGERFIEALQAWQQTVTSYPLLWLAHVPLLKLALDHGDHEQAIEYARRLLAPGQQQLLDPLPELLDNAVRAWVGGMADEAVQQMTTFCAEARLLGYL